MKSMKVINVILYIELGEDEYTVACLLMVFVAVSLPKLSRNEGSYYKAALEGLKYLFSI